MSEPTPEEAAEREFTVITTVAHHVTAENESEALGVAHALPINKGHKQSTQIIPGHQQFA